MRSSLSRVATTIVVVLVLSACASPPSPTPITTARPSGSPASSAPATQPPVLTPAPTATPTSPPAGAWPLNILSESTFEPAFGPDGTLYLLVGRRDPNDNYQQSLVALDTGGHVKPGWPLDEPPGSDFGPPAVAPDGSVYIEECGGPKVGCVLHRLGATGRELVGWPFHVPPDFGCPSGNTCFNGLEFGSNGTVFLTHWRTAGGLQPIAIDASGRLMPGWPVVLDAQGVWWSNAQVGSDGTLFMVRQPDGSKRPGVLAAFGSDGRLRAGWPASVPDNSDYLLGPRGTVVVWSLIDLPGDLCPSPRRTVFTVLGPNGRTLPGWPRGSTGFASSPVVGSDGTVYYVSARGNVYAHDRAGEVKAGWPVAVPGATDGCGPASPYLTSDGTIHVLGDEVTARSPDGRARPGWPYRPVGKLVWPCEQPGMDTDCVPHPVHPAFGPDGTVYIVVHHADPAGARLEVVALDRQGQLKPGWPYRLPFDPASVAVSPLTLSPDGRLLVRGGSQRYVLLALDPDGRLSD